MLIPSGQRRAVEDAAKADVTAKVERTKVRRVIFRPLFGQNVAIFGDYDVLHVLVLVP